MLAALGFGVALGHLSPNPVPDGPFATVVLEVLAPDTVTVVVDVSEAKGRPVTVHLWGIAAPKDAATARLATRLLTAALKGQAVVVAPERWNWRGDEATARVFLHGTRDVAAILARQGLVAVRPEG